MPAESTYCVVEEDVAVKMAAQDDGVRAGDAASAGWQVTLCDPVGPMAGSRSGAVLPAKTAIRFIITFQATHVRLKLHMFDLL